MSCIPEKLIALKCLGLKPGGLSMAGMPFMIAGVAGGVKMNYTRIFEALVIAGVTGAISVYATTKVLENDIEHIKQGHVYIMQQVDQLRKDLYVPRGSKMALDVDLTMLTSVVGE
jgi:hypothetical protein